MRLLLYRAVEVAVFAAWACTGCRPGRLAGCHDRAEARLRREEV